jgi:hypothetical protein
MWVFAFLFWVMGGFLCYHTFYGFVSYARWCEGPKVVPILLTYASEWHGEIFIFFT